ncbi:hypothetical protein BDQ12DRAFT_739779 [Crucibulum laeve]|uniref:DUF6534 domain-containing protein n=1 Tax=Crucibulum laeve TaxID=68775 RepID=A0A5C3LGF5_9AGAR|nr:hypothetical protein BDQ12DRAFT_739779 [Crucibulum laeve]
MSTIDIGKTFGALLIGGLYASVLSGLVAVQVVVYFKVYPDDSPRLKCLVLAVWFLDTCHTGLIWGALWNYLIDHYGEVERIDYVPWNIAVRPSRTIHCPLWPNNVDTRHSLQSYSPPYSHFLFTVSKANWFLTVPIVTLAILRLVTTEEMITLHSFSAFKQRIRWIFTLGLALSSAVDILITGSLFFLLQTSRTGTPNLNVIIDSLIRYAFETGSLTCAGTVISMILWLAMPSNLIFMGLHFVIGKLYANSLLVTLNTRQTLRRARSQTSGDHVVPVHYLDTRRNRTPDRLSTDPSDMTSNSSKAQKLEISVERSVQYDD